MVKGNEFSTRHVDYICFDLKLKLESVKVVKDELHVCFLG